jgi:hypothetical protein
MNEGKPYPKSGCEVCGSILFGNKLCLQNVKPNPPVGSTLGPQHYVNTVSEPVVSEAKYAVIYKDTISHEGDQRSRDFPGHGYPAWTETIEKIQTFPTRDKLVDWIEENSTGYNRKSFTAIEYNELKVTTKTEVTLA